MMEAEYWQMSNPLLGFAPSMVESISSKLRGLPEPYGGMMSMVLDSQPGLLEGLVRDKLDAEHRQNLEAIAAELAADGFDVGSPPWAVRSNPGGWW